MRRRHTPSGGETPEINMTPLIDMVFILLIFFLVTASFVNETGIAVSRPAARTAAPQPKEDILIAVSGRGEIWMARRRIDLGALRAQVARLHAAQPERGVMILADAAVETGMLVRVIDQAKRAGVARVAIAARKGPE